MQLFIECEKVNQNGYDKAKLEYDHWIKLKEYHPVHLVFTGKKYFVSRFKKQPGINLKLYYDPHRIFRINRHRHSSRLCIKT